MTAIQIKRTFERLDSRQQAELLVELAASLARSLGEAERRDERVFRRRAGEERRARPWREVREALRLSPRTKER